MTIWPVSGHLIREVFRRLAAQEAANLGSDDVGDPVHDSAYIDRLLTAFTPPCARTGDSAGAPREPRPRLPQCPGTKSITALTVPALALPFSIQALAQGVHQRGTDDDAIGTFGHFAGAGRIVDAESDGHRQVGLRLMRAPAAATVAAIGRGRTGDAGDRDVIDEARGVAEHRRQAVVIGGGGGQADEGEPGLRRRQAQLSSASGGRSTTMSPSTPALLASSRYLRRRRRRPDCNSPSIRSASRPDLGIPAPASVSFNVFPAPAKARCEAA